MVPCCPLWRYAASSICEIINSTLSRQTYAVSNCPPGHFQLHNCPCLWVVCESLCDPLRLDLITWSTKKKRASHCHSNPFVMHVESSARQNAKTHMRLHTHALARTHTHGSKASLWAESSDATLLACVHEKERDYSEWLICFFHLAKVTSCAFEEALQLLSARERTGSNSRLISP